MTVTETTDRPGDEERGEEKAALLQQGLAPRYGGEAALPRSGAKAPKAEGGEAAADDEGGDDLCPASVKYYPSLDVTRIVCVGMVAVDHGDAEFSMWNALMSQDWVLQFLFLVCGVCYGMSKKSLLQYEARLLCYAVLGICINWSAWLLMGMDWKSNFFNVVFQVWFIFGIMLYAVILAPLRSYLARVREQSDSQGFILTSEDAAEDAALPPSRGHSGDEKTITVRRRAQDRDSLLWAVAVIFGGFLALLVLFHVVVQPLLSLLAPLVLDFFKALGTGVAFWGLPEDAEETYAFLQRLCQYTNASVTNIYLIVVCTKTLKRRQLAPWAVLTNTYINRLLFYRAQDERPFHGLDLTMIALSVYYLGLLHRRALGSFVVRYWFCIPLAATLIWPLGAYGRFDEVPPTTVGMRVRYNSLEAICVICWLLAADRIFDIRIFTEDRLDFMNDWALLVFLVHKAIHIMLPVPWNWIAIVALIPASFLRRHYL